MEVLELVLREGTPTWPVAIQIFNTCEQFEKKFQPFWLRFLNGRGLAFRIGDLTTWLQLKEGATNFCQVYGGHALLDSETSESLLRDRLYGLNFIDLSERIAQHCGFAFNWNCAVMNGTWKAMTRYKVQMASKGLKGQDFKFALSTGHWVPLYSTEQLDGLDVFGASPFGRDYLFTSFAFIECAMTQRSKVAIDWMKVKCEVKNNGLSEPYFETLSRQRLAYWKELNSILTLARRWGDDSAIEFAERLCGAK